MEIVDNTAKAQGFQAMLPMRDGARLNTFVFLPGPAVRLGRSSCIERRTALR